MDEAESADLLQQLAEHLVSPEYAYFHEWRGDEIIVGDNWRAIHSATGVPLDCRRRAVRTTISGDYKAGRLLDRARDTGPPRRFLD